MKPKTSVQKRNDSVGRRKRGNISTDHEKSDNSSDVPVKRRTRSSSKIILEETKRKEEELKNVSQRDTSLEMSKEEFVKSYNLRRTDDSNTNNQKRDNETSKRKSKGQVQNEQRDDKSQNTAKGKEDGAKDTDRNINSANIVLEGVQIAVENKPAEDESLNHDDNGQEGNSQDIDTAQDRAYWTENDTDTLNERSESTALDDTQKDPDFNVEQEVQKNSDLTITADETNADEEDKHSQVTPIVESKSTKKKTPKKFVNKKPAAKYKPVHEDEDQNDEEDDFYYHCDKCSRKFTDWKELQKHKIDCVKVPRKFQCSKCNRGFQQKSMMDQHFDFYHTKKPKKFVCNEHNKCYVYKKSYDEHLRRDHSDGNYRFVCDYCGKGFFHKSEFSIHRDSVHLNRKDYVCNKCQERAFTSIGRLNAHLAICGK